LGLLRDWVVIVLSTFTYHNPPHPGWGFFIQNRST
jgi:hypothetical protein